MVEIFSQMIIAVVVESLRYDEATHVRRGRIDQRPELFPPYRHRLGGAAPARSRIAPRRLARHAGDTIQASQFHDDALGRVLEDLADHGSKCLATLGMRM